MSRRFLGVVMVSAHAERATGNPDHSGGPLVLRLLFAPPYVGLRQRHGIDSDVRDYGQTSQKPCVRLGSV